MLNYSTGSTVDLFRSIFNIFGGCVGIGFPRPAAPGVPPGVRTAAWRHRPSPDGWFRADRVHDAATRGSPGRRGPPAVERDHRGEGVRWRCTAGGGSVAKDGRETDEAQRRGDDS
ncbi:hypothetical protein GCM10010423_18970 [Streptomyces levis]|uniref:Uncharacterized protein n=1 Tax=Streptomyces levis TaxID=285566 RepID=A0ABN3NKV1_9ACTN